MSDNTELPEQGQVIQLPTTLADRIKARTAQGQMLIERHLAIIERKAPWTDATVADVQRSLDWLSKRVPGWGEFKEGSEQPAAASPFANLTTEQLVALATGKGGGSGR